MAVKLRLRRMGKKRQPVYKVVAADARSPRDGKFIEAIGLYNPKTDPATIEIKEERALYWLGVGAQPTTTVKNLLSKSGLIYKRELIKKGLGEEEINSKIDEWKKANEAKSVKTRKKESPQKEKVEENKIEKDITEVEDTASAETKEEITG